MAIILQFISWKINTGSFNFGISNKRSPFWNLIKYVQRYKFLTIIEYQRSLKNLIGGMV